MLNFTQINLHKAAQATNLLGQDLAGKTQSICFITEPHTNAGKITGMPRGMSIIADKSANPTNPGPRAGILASKDLAANGMEPWCNRDCATAIVKLHGRQVLLASIYLDITQPVIPAWLDDLLNMAEAKQLPIIMGMDSNAHSTLFGPDNNARGEALEEFIVQHGLSVQNSGNTPTFEIRRGTRMIGTFIDVTLTRGLHFQLSNWRVDTSYNASDHNTIRFQTTQTQTETTRIRPWSKADWHTFGKELEAADYRIPIGMSMKKLDRLTDRLYEILGTALDRACPEIVVHSKIHHNHWANEKHTKKKAEVTRLYNQAKATGRDSDWNTYKQADKAFKRLCKRDKDRAWREYKESLQTCKDMASLARLAQRQERNEIGVLTRPDGSATDPGKETIDLLTRTHFPAATERRHIKYNNLRNCPTEALYDKYQDWINTAKIKQALAGFEKKKSPGPDGIKPLLFEHLTPKFLSALDLAYRASIHLGYTPKVWKRTKVIFIAKPGKPSYDQPKSFRPISLSNYFLKGLERLVAWHMDEALVKHPIHHKQHGFLSGKSTESAISNTTDYIEKFIMRKQHCVGVFLDIGSAFDSVQASHIRRSLLDHGGDPEMVHWYYNYISHRDMEINIHGEHASFSNGVGFPQGGVCSAKFWLIAFNFAIRIINTHAVEGNGYADDCSVLFWGSNLDHAVNRLQRVLDSLTAWGR